MLKYFIINVLFNALLIPEISTAVIPYILLMEILRFREVK